MRERTDRSGRRSITEGCYLGGRGTRGRGCSGYHKDDEEDKMRRFILLMLISLCFTQERIEAADSKFKTADEFASYLEGIRECSTTRGALFCSLKFRDFQMDWDGANTNSAKLYVVKLGKNNWLSLHGCNCLRVAFGDSDLKMSGSDSMTLILFHKNGKIEAESSGILSCDSQ